MDVAESIQKRLSVRAFLDKPVPEDTLKRIFSDAQKSPSNCNVQPWQTYVVSGEKKDELKNLYILCNKHILKRHNLFRYHLKTEALTYN